jgi:arylsulfatase A-like enzyme
MWANVRTDTLYTPMDHMATVSALVDLKAPADVDGVDLSPVSPELLRGETIERDAVLMANYSANWDFFRTGSQPEGEWPEWRGVKTKRHTYVRWLTGDIELYDDENDPYQLENLAADSAHAPTVQELEAKLKQLLAEAHDEFPPGTEYIKWFDAERNCIRTGLGPVNP